jgi:hypothetical protein
MRMVVTASPMLRRPNPLNKQIYETDKVLLHLSGYGVYQDFRAIGSRMSAIPRMDF